MYDELVKRLRMRANLFNKINQTENCIMDEAADAIEELQKRVPKTPHGRLIDADALKSEIAEEDDGFGHDVYTAGIHDGFALSFECIDDAPTIIPAEEGEN